MSARALAMAAAGLLGSLPLGCGAPADDPGVTADAAAPDALDAGVADDMAPEPPDASPFAPVGDPEALTLGTGAMAFAPVAAGQALTLHRGCQGAQHVWLSLRLPEAAAGEWPLAAALLDADDAPLTPIFRLADEPWQAAPGGGAQIVGLTLVVFDPTAVVDQPVRLWAQVEGPGGAVSAVEAVTVVWGADAC